MEKSPHKWAALVAVDTHAEVQVSLWVDESLLMAAVRCEPPSRVISKLIVGLADFRDGDSISAVVHAAGRPFVSWSGGNAHLALHWIAGALLDAWLLQYIAAPARSRSFEKEPATGVRASLPHPPSAAAKANT